MTTSRLMCRVVQMQYSGYHPNLSPRNYPSILGLKPSTFSWIYMSRNTLSQCLGYFVTFLWLGNWSRYMGIGPSRSMTPCSANSVKSVQFLGALCTRNCGCGPLLSSLALHRLQNLTHPMCSQGSRGSAMLTIAVRDALRQTANIRIRAQTVAQLTNVTGAPSLTLSNVHSLNPLIDRLYIRIPSRSIDKL